MAPADALSLEQWAREALLAYAAAESDDDGFREDFKTLLDEHPHVLDDLARHDRAR
jgi:hypothetical protein